MSKTCTYTNATLVLNGVVITPARVTVTETPHPTLTAWTPVRLRGRTRRLCQFCGWTTRDEDLRADNKQHALAHLRAAGITRRFREGCLPVWGFVVNHLVRKGVAVTRDTFGHRLIADELQREAYVGTRTRVRTIRLPAEIKGAVLLTGSGFAESLAWVEASAAEEALIGLPAHWNATRARLEHLLAWWRLAESFPAWVAAAAVQELLAPRVVVMDFRSRGGAQHDAPAPGYMPAWTRGEYGVELVSPAREHIDTAIELLRRRAS